MQSEFDLPGQTLDEPIPTGLARVVFLNGPEGGTTVDGADKVNIAIDGKYLASLRKWQYVQVMLPVGSYEVMLIHKDVGHFRSGHVLDIEAGDNWVKAYSTITSNKLERLPTRPPNFPERYEVSISLQPEDSD